jgi:hypothetical protein
MGKRKPVIVSKAVSNDANTIGSVNGNNSRGTPDDVDDYYIGLQFVGYKNLYPYGPSKTTKVQNSK